MTLHVNPNSPGSQIDPLTSSPLRARLAPAPKSQPPRLWFGRGERFALVIKLLASALTGTMAVCFAPAVVAQAASAEELQALKDQVRELERRIDRLQQQQAQQPAPAAPSSASSATAQAPAAQAQAPAAQAQVPTAGAPTPAAQLTAPPLQPASGGASASFMAGPVRITPGGFVELMVVTRNRNESADWASNFNTGIPFPNSHNYYLSEFHLTERQSRLQSFFEGPQSDEWASEAYVEADFGGAGGTANNNESSSFSPRVRHYFADLTYKPLGGNLLFGQTWSLVTGFKQGLTARQENIPVTIDGQYLPGFDWLRVPQVRFTEKIDDMFAVAFSAENPAAQISNNVNSGTAPALGAIFNNPGATNSFTPTNGATPAANNVSLDYLPDLVLKAALDPGWGHYEIFGVQRFFRTREILIAHQNNIRTSGTGYGANLIVPLVPKILELQASILGGKGVGRYGSAQLPDATLNPATLGLEPLHAFQALAGLIVRPSPHWTVFGYFGEEQVSRWDLLVSAAGKLYDYGYGGSLFDNSGCETEGAAACAANTARIVSATFGGWWKFYQGYLGNAQIGLTDTWIRREIFSGLGGDPSTNINIALASFRFYPFQR